MGTKNNDQKYFSVQMLIDKLMEVDPDKKIDFKLDSEVLNSDSPATDIDISIEQDYANPNTVVMVFRKYTDNN